MVDFNTSKNSYRDTIQSSINFTGKEHDFFIAIKAGFLLKIIKKMFRQGQGHQANQNQPKILDIGCGHGYMHKYLAEDCKVVGVEVASEVLELAREANPNILYMSYDGKTLPFESKTFDVVFAVCVMHHIPPEQWKNFLGEMKRVLKPGGISVIFEHNPYNPLTRYIVAKNPLDKDATLLTHHHLKNLLLDAGLRNVKSRFILFTPFANAVFRWLDNFLGWCPLGAQYYSVSTES